MNQQDPLQQWFMEVPPVTRGYLVVVVLTSLACQLDLVSPFHLYFNWDLIVKGRQWWRLFTSFAFYGNLGVDFLFHLFFLARYSRALEEASFRGRTGDFLWMLLIVAGMIVVCIPSVESNVPAHCTNATNIFASFSFFTFNLLFGVLVVTEESSRSHEPLGSLYLHSTLSPLCLARIFTLFEQCLANG